MEEQAIYKDEHLTETAKLIDQLLEERGCQLVCAGQFMVCLTDNSNKGGNVGVRYINQMPNGMAKNAPSVFNPLVFGVEKISDPSFILK